MARENCLYLETLEPFTGVRVRLGIGLDDIPLPSQEIAYGVSRHQETAFLVEKTNCIIGMAGRFENTPAREIFEFLTLCENFAQRGTELVTAPGEPESGAVPEIPA